MCTARWLQANCKPFGCSAELLLTTSMDNGMNGTPLAEYSRSDSCHNVTVSGTGCRYISIQESLVSTLCGAHAWLLHWSNPVIGVLSSCRSATVSWSLRCVVFAVLSYAPRYSCVHLCILIKYLNLLFSKAEWTATPKALLVRKFIPEN